MGTAFVTIVAVPAAGQGVPLLVGRLQHAGPDAVPDDEGHQRDQPRAAVPDQLRRDVADGEQQAGREPERGGAPEIQRDGDEERGAGAARREPVMMPNDRRVRLGGRGPDDRQAEQDQPGKGEDDGELLAPGQPGRMPACRHEGQDRDSGGDDAFLAPLPKGSAGKL